ncbi:hypothetical protein BBP40_009251 [Aspergillus hancockii]|nr:hypothetical protein BBP40_009251 [Aspergillus hancockii]
MGYSIVHSPPFTFLVGANHTKLTVQSGLARHVSQPLDHLMNSGETRESKHHIAVLEEEDVETFVAFCEYAYTGDYSVPGPDNREEYQEQIVNNPFKGVFSGGKATAQDPVHPPPKASGNVDKEQNKPTEEVQQLPEEQAPLALEPENPPVWNDAPEEPPAAPIDPPREPEPVPEEPSEQPPATPAAEEGDPLDANESASSGKGKKGKKGKKDKKKKGAATTEEPVSNLTPPSTPPPQKPELVENPPADETAAQTEECSQQQELTETPGVAEPADVAQPAVLAEPSTGVDTWEQSTPTPQEPESTEPERTDMNGGGKEEERVVEQQKPSHYRSNSFIDMSFARQRFNFQQDSGTSLWDEFAGMDYDDPRQTHGNRPPSSLSYSASTKGDLPYLVFHAKLYVFATRFLIPALAQLCLRKLHRDLLNLGFPDYPMDSQDEEVYTLSTTKARMILDLLDYTYNKTTRLEPISAISATQLRDNELRRLVVHYAACKIRDLADYCPPVENTAGMSYPHKPSAKGLRPLMDTTTELASDLVYRMMM